MSLPRSRTPAEIELQRAIDRVRELSPEWHVAEQTARALDLLAKEIATERDARHAAEEEAEREADREQARQSWRLPLWRALKAVAAAISLGLAGVTVNALISHGDSRRAAAQQADVIREHTAAIESLAKTLDVESRQRAEVDALLRESIAADHAVLQLLAPRVAPARAIQP